MADRKITDLTALTTPASADVLPIVDVSEAAAADKNKKITVGELFKGIPDGTAAAPAIAFESDDGNGLFLSTTDTIGIATNGVSRATVSTTAVTSTLPVIVPDGSAAAPSVAFTGSGTDTGLYSPGADQVAISTNGTGRLFVDASGNVGVGTSPSQLFHVAGASPVALLAASSGVGTLRLTRSTTTADLSVSTSLASLATTSATDLAFSTNNTERLRITSAGLVGVGTSSPGYKLDVGTTSDASNHINIKTSATGTASFYFSDTNNGQAGIDYNHSTDKLTIRSADATAITIDSSQRVGIGTTAPDVLLTTRVASGPIARFRTADTNFFGIDIGTDGASQTFIESIKGGSGSYQPLAFWTGGSQRAAIDTSGRLLVGTSSDLSNYDVQIANANGDGFLSMLSYSSTASNGVYVTLNHSKSGTLGTHTLVSSGDMLGTFRFRGSDGSSFVDSAAITAEVDGTPGANDMPGRLVFSTTADGASSPTERMRITNSGSVFIGTQSALNNEIYSFAASQGSGGDGVLHVRNTLSSGADASPCLVLSKTATTTTSSARFIQFYANNATQAMGGIVGNGATNVQFASISDIREKENIAELTGCLDKIKQLDVVSYDWKDNRGHVEAGFIAQNVETVFPEYVVENMSDDGAEPRKGITGGMSSGYVAVLTAALQEAVAKIETLEAKVAALESA